LRPFGRTLGNTHQGAASANRSALAALRPRAPLTRALTSEAGMTTQEQQLIASLARRVESVPASVARCSALWLDLISGKLTIVRAFIQEHHSVLILQTRALPGFPLGARAREMLERTLLGERRKVIAYDTNISPSTLALALKESLASLGLRCLPSRVPSSLVILAHAACVASEPIGTFIGDCTHAGRRVTLLTHVFDDSVLGGLPPSERAVMNLLASGRSRADIAAQRNCSCNTVTNQIAAACRRLGVSGRLELLHRLATPAVRMQRDP
jgi:DNA-binding CsgD family transcriptional regulator